MTIVNLTPHPLVLDGITIQSSGIARCETKEQVVGQVTYRRESTSGKGVFDCGPFEKSLPIVRQTFGKVVGLPEPTTDTIFIVSAITAQAVPDRTDVFVPARPIRDEKGNIIGAAAIATLSKHPATK
jgi:hypothetical protein